MSFDVFTGAFEKFEFYYYDRSIVEIIFSPYIKSIDRFGWSLSIGGFVYIDEDEKIDNFCVNCPPRNPIFWDLILKVLQQTPSVIYWPSVDGTAACVANPAVIRAMPPDMVETLGYPLVVSRGEGILAAIERD